MDNVLNFPVSSPTSPAPPAPSPDAIDITGEAFARRLGNLLTHRRTTSKLSVGAIARRSDKNFTRRQLHQFEAGEVLLDVVTASALASLYKVDLESIMPNRTDIRIDKGGGVISAGGVEAAFKPGDPDSLLETYLRLVRRLRDQQRDDTVALRREDIEGLAAYLGQSGETVVDRLGTLMGATKVQRRVMATMFITGAMVITVAIPTVAAFVPDGRGLDDEGASDSIGNSVLHDEVADSSDGVGIGGPDPIDDGFGSSAPVDPVDLSGDLTGNDGALGDAGADRVGGAATGDPATDASAGGSTGGTSGAPSAPGGSSIAPDEVAVTAPPVPVSVVPIADTPIADAPIAGAPVADVTLPKAPSADPGTAPSTDDGATPDEIAVIEPPVPVTPDPVGPEPGSENTVPSSDPPMPDSQDQQPDDQNQQVDPDAEQPDDQSQQPDDLDQGEEEVHEEDGEDNGDQDNGGNQGNAGGNQGGQGDQGGQGGQGGQGDQGDQGNAGDNQGGQGDQGGAGGNEGNAGGNQGNAGENGNQGNAGDDQSKSGSQGDAAGDNQGSAGDDQGSAGDDQGNAGNDKGDKDTGLASANQHANENAGGLTNANQHANESANPNR